MDPTYWLKKWEINDIRFHQDRPHAQLMKNFESLPVGKVLVPLCGKSLDMLWLRSQGHQVVGVELSALACEAFFSENEISFTKMNRGEFCVYAGEGFTIWCGDFFKLPDEAMDGVTAIYDRAALMALTPEDQRTYANQIVRCAKLNKKTALQMLLITVEYPEGAAQGPPFSILEQDIRRLYGETFDIEQLDRYADTVLSGHHPKFLHTTLFEAAYRLTTRAI